MRDRMSEIVGHPVTASLQSPLFQDHVTKKRRALGTRMCPFKKALDLHDSFLVG